MQTEIEDQLLRLHGPMITGEHLRAALGYEATRRILEVAPSLPIIGQTAHAFGEDRDRCLAVGMVGHISKPIEPKDLIALILQVVGPKKGKRSLIEAI